MSNNGQSKWLARHIAALPRSGIRDFFELVNEMDDVISLGVGEPDFPTPWGIREATIYALEKGHTNYTSNLGLLRLREVACDYVAANFGIRYHAAAECIITVGVSEALDLILRAILNPGDEVVYHEPCYVSYAPSIQMAHAVPVPVQTVESAAFALEPDKLEKAITKKTKAILLNFPNNPTGYMPTPAEGARAAFEEVSLRKGDFAIAAVAAEVRLSGGVVASARIGIAGVAERGLRATRMEAALTGVAPTTAAIETAADGAIEAIDFSGTAAISPAYRRDLTRALLVRAVSRAVGLAGETTR